MNMKTYTKFMLCMAPVIILGSINQYYYLYLRNGGEFAVDKLEQLAAILLTAAIIRLLPGKPNYSGWLYSAPLYFCILPGTSGFLLTLFAFAGGVLLSRLQGRVNGHDYGLNPAVAGRLIIFLWDPPFSAADALTGATPLSHCLLRSGAVFCPDSHTVALLSGAWGGAIGETSKIAVLLGGAGLVIFRLYKPDYLIAATAGALGAWLLAGYGFSADSLIQFWHVLLMGSLLFGVIFMTTDRFTLSLGYRGRICFYFLVGLLCFSVRFTPWFAEGTLLALIAAQLIFMLCDGLLACLRARHRQEQRKKTGP